MVQGNAGGGGGDGRVLASMELIESLGCTVQKRLTPSVQGWIYYDKANNYQRQNEIQ